MPCGGAATHSSYQPYRAFNMAAAATQVGANIVTGGGDRYGNPSPQPYPSTGQNPYGPEFPPPPGAAGPVPTPMPSVREPGPYGHLPPNYMRYADDTRFAPSASDMLVADAAAADPPTYGTSGSGSSAGTSGKSGAGARQHSRRRMLARTQYRQKRRMTASCVGFAVVSALLVVVGIVIYMRTR